MSFTSKKEKNDKIMAIKPHSLADVEDWLYVCDDSKHYKEIYGIYLYKS